MLIFSYPSVKTYVLGTQKNCLIETVLLSTHNICFGWEIRKLNFRYVTKVLPIICYKVPKSYELAQMKTGLFPSKNHVQ